ncbi:hypothetical protein [Actinocorallia sp. A-T 12471]|uniref:hypothetical protein n=1 Tax=Actinocorallia sp. A-T 12471 TaxID=3089813 RepID=UPI0029D00D93|nr:hypothetical protein [Actinocorallia sp. A-T 12471]MDX6738369.1 hypothetical protein [Actinocorallia sp. A-T 12471]
MRPRGWASWIWTSAPVSRLEAITPGALPEIRRMVLDRALRVDPGQAETLPLMASLEVALARVLRMAPDRAWATCWTRPGDESASVVVVIRAVGEGVEPVDDCASLMTTDVARCGGAPGQMLLTLIQHVSVPSSGHPEPGSCEQQAGPPGLALRRG